MKKNILILFIFIYHLFVNSQATAYDATYSNYALAPCIDITLMDRFVKGHQLDYNVDYFLTQEDAENNTNPLPFFYSYTSFDQILYARVTNNLISTDYAVSQVFLDLQSLPCCPPPPPGLYGYFICDTDNDGFSTAYLPHLREQHGYGFPGTSYCDLDDTQVFITYHLSQEDAMNASNNIPETFTFSSEGAIIWFRYNNTENNDFYVDRFSLAYETCDGLDTDNDGINDKDEDVNKNGYFEDDDTDRDGLKNYEDNDDDNDLILTIDEDYNNNGTPLDDDTNINGIADYLESNVTLSNETSTVYDFEIYPNPVSEEIHITAYESILNGKILLIDINGKVMYSKEVSTQNLAIDISGFESGIYFLNIQTQTKLVIERVIKL